MKKSEKRVGVTPDAFRRMALKLPDTIESAHMDHPDFRLGGKIFATLGYPDKSHGMVKLAPGDQRAWVRAAPKVFAPCTGAWGKNGATSVNLTQATADDVAAALESAWRNLQ